MTGMSTGQMPECCWRNNDVNGAYSKKQKQKQKLLRPADGATIYNVWLPRALWTAY